MPRKSRKRVPRVSLAHLSPERLAHIQALKALVVTGERERILQAVELLVSLGDPVLIETVATGISFADDGLLLIQEENLVNEWLEEWLDADKKPYFHEKTARELSVHLSAARELRNWTAWQVAAAAGRLAEVKELSYRASGRVDLSELRAIRGLRVLDVFASGSLEDISDLEALTSLEVLELELPDGISFEPLSRCTQLREVIIDLHDRENDQVATSTLDLAVFASHTRLQSLVVKGFRVTGGLGHLLGCAGLRRLDVGLHVSGENPAWSPYARPFVSRGW
ncbi:MAG: hypothetical protein RL653_1859 [Pseudomonadota bacterium]|jgi:hypothetical protein